MWDVVDVKDPGATQFYLSLEDDLRNRFRWEKNASNSERLLRFSDDNSSSKIATRQVESSQNVLKEQLRYT